MHAQAAVALRFLQLSAFQRSFVTGPLQSRYRIVAPPASAAVSINSAWKCLAR